jgi:sulfotransferase famil protein
MLMSRKHRFLFVHIYKNAGISITTALLPFAATERQLRLDRILNQVGLSYLNPRVIRRSSSVRDWISNGMNNVFERMTFMREHPQPVHDPHLGASEIIAKIGRDTFDAYYSFGIVRNPWDWQVSLYRFALETVLDLPPLLAYARGLGPERHTYLKLTSFDDYIRWRCTEDVHTQESFLFSSDGEQLVDYIGKYENLEADFRTICDRIGINATLPKLNESSTRRRYQEYYTPETVELVRKAFASDIELFGYEFE